MTPLTSTRPHAPGNWSVRQIAMILAMAAVYFASGKLGLSLAYLNKSATPVWPPTGLSIAAVLLVGTRVWPGVLLGAFLVNITLSPLPVALGIAIGNTLESIVAAWIARRWAHGRFAFNNPRDILIYVLGAAVFSTTISATIGIASLSLGGFGANTGIAAVWLTWWLGDMVSAIIVAPLFLVWNTGRPADWTPHRQVEAAVILGALSLVGVFVFSGIMNPLPSQSAWRFLCFPAMLWAAYRFGPHGAVTSSALLCAIAIGSAVLGLTPMLSENPNTSLLMLQTFMATVTLTNLILGAVSNERRRAEDALRFSEKAARLSEARKSAVLESALDAIITMDAHGRIIDFNPASEQVFGLRRADVIGRAVADVIIPPRLREAHWRGLRSFESSGDSNILGRRVEMTAIRSDGTEFPVEIAISVTSSLDQPDLFTASIRDLSDRKRDERRQELRLVIAQTLARAVTTDQALTDIIRSVCETMGGWITSAIWVVDRQAQVLRCAHFWQEPRTSVAEFADVSRLRTFAKNVGLPGRVWERAEPVWIQDVVVDDNFPRKPEAMKSGLHTAVGFPIIMGGEVFAVMEFFSRRLESLDSAMLSTLAEVGMHIGQFLDRRRTEDDLRASQQQLRLITDSMSAPVTRCSRDLSYRWVSKPYADWLHLSPEEIINRPIVDVIGKKAFERLKPYFDRVLSGEIVSYEDEIHFTGIGPRWINAVYSPTLDSNGRIDGWVAVIIDIHERIQAQRTLQEADRRKDEFLAILAHELRNPLAPVRTAVALLERVARDNPDVLELRETIDRQVTQMARLLDDLLDVSRIASGKIHIRRDRITLREVVEGALESSRPLIEAQSHRLTVSVPAETVYLDADLTRLAQVFSNLLNNAAKYTEFGGHIRLTAEADGENAVVRVKDNGIGIPPEMLPHVFEMFVQVDPVSESARGGLGIGLTLVRRLVEAHGGSVEARSEGLDRGSEFVVTLPRVAIDRADKVESQDAGAVSAAVSRLRILVADDNVDSATLLKRLLVMMGHEVRIAHDGLQAAEIARSFRPQAALLDIGMPKLNGYEVARRIRAESNGSPVMLVAMTGWGQDEDKRRAKEAGFDQHLTKPMDMSAIECILQTIPMEGNSG